MVLNLTIDSKLEKRFRDEVGKRFGQKKGNINKAVEEAFRDWISK